MATGYDENGIEDLDCVGLRKPTVFCGMYPIVYDYAPQIALDDVDFSWETWLKWALGPTNPTGDVPTLLGFGQEDTPPSPFWQDVANLRISSNTYMMRLTYDSTPLVGPNEAETAFVAWTDPLWFHVVCNFTRLGNMSLIINTAVQDVAAMNNNDLGNRRFYPVVGGIGSDLTFDPSSSWDCIEADYHVDWSSFIQGRIHQGPVAVHNQLMSQAEINDSYARQTVQNIPGVTQLMWDWREIQGATGWEYDRRRIMSAIRATLSWQAMAPTGAAGTVTVPDLSGNGNDLTLPTATSYGMTLGPLVAGTKSWVAFEADPFWR